MKKFLLIIIASLSLTGCIVDSFDTSPSAQPDFSVGEVLDMGLFFAETPSPTSQLMIYNRNSRIINLSTVTLRSGQHFRINVDGRAGKLFNDVEIRPNDSIYVFVECTLPASDSPEPQEVTDWLDVTTNGVLRSVKITALSQKVNRLERFTVSSDMTLQAEIPNLITDTLRVAPGATLTLAPGARLMFHDKAALVVEGTLISRATAEAPVELRGDRTNNVVANISFDVMSNQWEGVYFAPESRGNYLSHTSVVNTCQGVTLDSLTDLTIVNSRLHNSGGKQLTVGRHSSVTALGCDISNAASALLHLDSGTFTFNRCTLANYYLFAWPDMAAIMFTAPDATTATFSNSIIISRDKPVGDYGNVEEADIMFRRCIFQPDGSDDSRYIDCLWATDPLLKYSLTDYTFSYIPWPDSPAINAANPGFDHEQLPENDRYGRPRALTIGAYAPEN